VPDAEVRTLLRQQIVDGLSIQEIGAAFGFHCPTAARWLPRARGALVTVTRNRVIPVRPGSADEVMRHRVAHGLAARQPSREQRALPHPRPAGHYDPAIGSSSISS